MRFWILPLRQKWPRQTRSVVQTCLYGLAAGSGIPQLKLAFWKDFGTLLWRVAWVKFVAGIVSIGGGSSLGREYGKVVGLITLHDLMWAEVHLAQPSPETV